MMTHRTLQSILRKKISKIKVAGEKISLTDKEMAIERKQDF